MGKPLEKDIQGEILKWLWNLNIFSWRNNSGMFPADYKGKQRMIQFGAKGSPDIIGITSGLFLGIEVKRPGGKQTEAQAAFQQNIERAGGYYILATSVENVEDGIKQISHDRKRKKGAAHTGI